MELKDVYTYIVAISNGNPRNPFNGIERYFKRGDFPFTKGKIRIHSMELKANMDMEPLSLPYRLNPFNGIERHIRPRAWPVEVLWNPFNGIESYALDCDPAWVWVYCGIHSMELKVVSRSRTPVSSVCESIQWN